MQVKVYGVSFQFELPDDVAERFGALLPSVWLRSAGPEGYRFVVRRKGAQLELSLGEQVLSSTPDAATMATRLVGLLQRGVASHDRERAYLGGGAIRWRDQVWAFLGYPRRGISTLLEQLARDGGRLLSDGLVIISPRAQLLPFAQAERRPQRPDRIVVSTYDKEATFQAERLRQGSAAALMVRMAVPNPKFLPVFAELGRDVASYFVRRGEAELAVEALKSLE